MSKHLWVWRVQQPGCFTLEFLDFLDGVGGLSFKPDSVRTLPISHMKVPCVALGLSALLRVSQGGSPTVGSRSRQTPDRARLPVVSPHPRARGQ